MKYSIGDLKFKTKKECENYTRNLINTLGCCIISKDNENFNFFNNLLKNHPKYEIKKGVGIDYFYIQNNPLTAKYYQTLIKRLDNSDVDFSWVYCCQFRERENKFYLDRAMRFVIKNDTIGFKQKQIKLICVICNVDNKLYEDYHVDHDNPSFCELKNTFLQLTAQPIPIDFLDYNIDDPNIFKDEDKIFENEWKEYHNQNCNLQILCDNCNLNKNTILELATKFEKIDINVHLSVIELKDKCKQLNLKGYSKKNKPQLLELLQQYK